MIKKFQSFLLIIFVLALPFAPIRIAQALNGYDVPHVWDVGVSTASGTYFGAVMGSGSSATEAHMQFRVTKAGTFSGLSGVASTANGSGTSTLRFRINGANGNQTINWTSGQTGTKRDTTNSDTVAVGDLVSISLTTTAGSITLSSITNLFEATNGDTIQFLMATGSEAFGTNSSTRYYRPVGELEILSTEATRQNYIRQAGTASDLAVYLTANTRTSTTTFRLRKNTANGNGVISVGASTTGLVRDSSNTDSFAADDIISYSVLTGGGSGAFTIVNMQVTFKSTNPTLLTLLGGVNRARTSSATAFYMKFAGSFGPSTTVELANQFILNVDATLSKLSVRVSPNASNRDITTAFRNEAVTGNQNITHTAATAGWEIDTTNSDTVSPTHKLAVRTVPTSAGTGNITYVNISMLATLPTISPTFTQSAYRLFENDDSTDVGSALAAQDTPAALAAAGDAFRLRMLMTVGDIRLDSSGEDFKLQYVDKGSGSCAAPSGGTPASYTDVTTGTLIAYNDNATPADGVALTSNANDPTNGGNTIVNQRYEESNDFTNAGGVILNGQEGKWDFSLKDNGAAASSTYCLRAVKSDGTVFGTYTVYPEISIPGGSQSITFSISDNTIGFGNVSTSATRYATGDTTGTGSETVAHTFDVNTNATAGYVVSIKGDTLKNGSYSINACGASCTLSPGTEQFGLRITASGGTGAVESPYNHGSDYAYDANVTTSDTIASASSGDGVTTTYSVRYATNVSSTTEAGSYSGAYSYTVTPSF